MLRRKELEYIHRSHSSPIEWPAQPTLGDANVGKDQNRTHNDANDVTVTTQSFDGENLACEEGAVRRSTTSGETRRQGPGNASSRTLGFPREI